MSRDLSGNYTLPENTQAVTGATLSSAKYNTLNSDIEAALNAPWPASAGLDLSLTQSFAGFPTHAALALYTVPTDVGLIVTYEGGTPLSRVRGGTDSPVQDAAGVNWGISRPPPGGAAGGDLSGTYPNPTIKWENSTGDPRIQIGDTEPTTRASGAALQDNDVWLDTANDQWFYYDLATTTYQPVGGSYSTVDVYAATGADQDITIPVTATSAEILIWGAGGGNSTGAPTVNGGAGSCVTFTADLTDPTCPFFNGGTVKAVVGLGGTAVGPNNTIASRYGFSGAMSAATTSRRTGGGLSGLFTGTAAVAAGDTARAIAVAGGGGACYPGGGGIASQTGNAADSATTGAGGSSDMQGSQQSIAGAAGGLLGGDGDFSVGQSNLPTGSWVSNPLLITSTDHVAPNNTAAGYVNDAGSGRVTSDSAVGGGGLVIIRHNG